MAQQWPGGIIRKTPPTPAGPYQDGAASGVWTLDQMNYWLKQNLWPIAGKVAIEDLFSTYLYTGNGTGSNTITNNIDLSGKGGMVWIKSRSAAEWHSVSDTARGASLQLYTNSTSAQGASGILSFNSSGFTVDGASQTNLGSTTYTSWTFRKQAKFFDVVTYTGNGANRTIAHNLGSVPGCIIVKRTDTTAAWAVYHRSLANTQYMVLNTTAAAATGATYWNSTTPTSSVFSLGTSTDVNASGGTYVAYLFAHDAGGFGATGSDNVISCGSYTGNGSTTGPTITLGYEPQFLLVKQTNAAATAWRIQDNMRSLNATGTANLFPNYDFAEIASPTVRSITPTATGFFVNPSSSIDDYNASGGTYIYIAIRRGPMKTPTTGTSVFSPIASSAATGTTLTTSFPVDAQIFSLRTGTTNKNNTYDRLRGVSSTTTESGARLITSSTAAETAAGNETRLWDNTSFQMPSTFGGASTVFWNFRRAPGFFDVVCYKGTGSLPGVAHNLGVMPELKIIKSRNFTTDWIVGGSLLGGSSYIYLQDTAGKVDFANYWDGGDDSATVFSVRNSNGNSDINGWTFVAYLFASVPGVSKVGSYTGTGTTQQINCGFTAGARFVLIKRTNSTGDWYVWDSARGIVAGNDPYLLLNSTAAEVTSTDYIDTYSAGFEISSTAPAAINANGGTFIFLAIA